jgi:site-specific recombinase XerD
MRRAAHVCPSSVVPHTVRDVITGFLPYVMVERGPARSTQAGYGRDVQQFFVW